MSRRILFSFAYVFVLLLAVPSWAAKRKCYELVTPSSQQRASWDESWWKAFPGLSEDDYKPAFGVEIEGYVPVRVGHEGSAQIALQTLKEMRPEAPLYPMRSLVVGIEISQDDEVLLSITEDNSLQPDRGHEGIEVVSGIIRSEQGLTEYLSVLAALKEQAKMTTGSFLGGLHVHVGVPHMTVQERILLARIFMAFEGSVASYFGFSENRRRWANPLSAHFIDLFSMDPLQVTEKDLMVAVQSDNHLLNVWPHSTKGQTVEFKVFNSTLGWKEIRRSIAFAVAFVKAVRTKKPELLEFLSGRPLDKPLPFDLFREQVLEPIPPIFSSNP